MKAKTTCTDADDRETPSVAADVSAACAADDCKAKSDETEAFDLYEGDRIIRRDIQMHRRCAESGNRAFNTHGWPNRWKASSRR